MSPEPEKWSPLLGQSDRDNEIVLRDEDELTYPSLAEDDLDKRNTLFRFGKRQGSLFRFGKRGSIFRFGKRGSIFRFGKRQGSLFRFGKRGGSIFRFGRSGFSENPSEDVQEDKRTLFRFGKRSDLDLLRDYLAQTGQLYPEGAENKRGIDSFHWGEETDDM